MDTFTPTVAVGLTTVATFVALLGIPALLAMVLPFGMGSSNAVAIGAICIPFLTVFLTVYALKERFVLTD